MKHFLLGLLLIIATFSFAQIDCYVINANDQIDNSTIYKYDADGDGVKDFWFHFTSIGGSAEDVYVVGKNGSEVEVDAAGGVDANRLQQGNQIGNNFWNDTAYLIHQNVGGNFNGSNNHGLIGIKFHKAGVYYLGWVEVAIYGGYAVVQARGPGNIAGVCSTTSIDDLHNAISVSLFPNPATSTLNFISTETRPAIIRLFENSGRQISEIKQNLNESIDISQLSAGIYFAEIQIGGAQMQRVKWVKM